MSETRFVCHSCNATFTVPEAALAKYPGWSPKQCLRCRKSQRGGRSAAEPRPRPKGYGIGVRPRPGTGSRKEQLLTPDEVLGRYTAGPFDGVFTDGACSGNPGPGGWGVVWVENDQIRGEKNGYAPQTTNNRMEMTALIAAYEMLPADSAATIWSDSRLCVNTINEWADGWRKNGWRRKSGPIKNLELVQQAYALSQAHPETKLRWIKAHNGARWNEYADALATEYMRK